MNSIDACNAKAFEILSDFVNHITNSFLLKVPDALNARDLMLKCFISRGIP